MAITLGRRRRTLTVNTAGVEPLVLGLHSDASLGELKAVLPAMLEDFKIRVMEAFESSDQVDWLAMTKGLAALKFVGDNILSRLLPEEDQGALCQYVRGIWSSREFDRWGNTSPQLMIRADSTCFVPLDLIPMLNPDAAGEAVYDDMSLYRALGAYPAFFCRVSRDHKPEVKDAASSAMIAPGVSKLLVIFFQNDELDGSGAEYRYLGSQAARIEVDGPYPGPTTTMEDVGRIILGDAPSDILHFSCHAGQDAVGEVGIRVRSGENELRIATSNLHGWIGDRGNHGLPSHFSRLVFLNACGSAQASVLFSSSLPRIFLQHHSAAVIGVETYVPDQIAQLISRYLYEQLLTGIPLDLALHKARLTLMRRHQNPLGCLYSLYQSGQELAFAVTEGTTS